MQRSVLTSWRIGSRLSRECELQQSHSFSSSILNVKSAGNFKLINVVMGRHLRYQMHSLLQVERLLRSLYLSYFPDVASNLTFVTGICLLKEAHVCVPLQYNLSPYSQRSFFF